MKVYCVYKVMLLHGKEVNQFVTKFYYETDAQKCCRAIIDNIKPTTWYLDSCPLKVYYTEEEE